MQKNNIFFILYFFFLSVVHGQENTIPIGKFDDNIRDKNTIRVCFYNAENLFDPENDSLKNDDDFTPEGNYHYSYSKFHKKVNNIAQVIVAMGGWEAPEIVGLCEIENNNVLKKLIYSEALKKYKYRFVHYESEDSRGIDVALIYRYEKFKVINSMPIPIIDSTNLFFKTRDILYVQGTLPDKLTDTLHIFVNHWPSRYGGYSQTIGKRNLAAKTLRSKIDSILIINEKAAIIVIGDFNDYPYDESISKYLNAVSNPKKITDNQLLNTMYPYLSMNNVGSHKYQANWGILDQIIVSKPMINSKEGWTIKSTAVIFNADFLLIPDDTHMGVKPFRTYIGMRYQGGFSDHLPIFIDLICK